MSGANLSPEKITSPFQLMAAWFAMLVLIISIILTAAVNIAKPDWAAAYLVIFSSLLIVGVIACVLLMLTKFRPHLQDGKEYAEWLKDKGRYSEGVIIQTTNKTNRLKTKESNSTNIKKPKFTSKDFLISVVNAVQSLHMIESLKNKGYNAEVYTGHGIDEKVVSEIKGKQESIWVGSELSAAQIVPAIKQAVSLWPELKYMHLSDDGGDPPDYVHEQLFIGGSTTTATKRYALEKWTVEEFMELDENMTTKELHQRIRSKYP